MIGAVRWSLPEMYRPALGLGQLIIAPLASRCTAVLPSPWPVGSPKDRKWRLPEAHVGGQLLLVLPRRRHSPRIFMTELLLRGDGAEVGTCRRLARRL